MRGDFKTDDVQMKCGGKVLNNCCGDICQIEAPRRIPDEGDERRSDATRAADCRR